MIRLSAMLCSECHKDILVPLFLQLHQEDQAPNKVTARIGWWALSLQLPTRNHLDLTTGVQQDDVSQIFLLKFFYFVLNT